MLGPAISGPHADELQALADTTGGKLYHGADEDMAQVTDGLFQETIDYTTNSNSDGISDYFSKLICEGTIGLANGTFPYKGIDFNADADYDHDGVKNGDEIQVRVYYTTDETGTSVKRVYLHKISDPTTKETPFNFNSRAMAMLAALSYIDGSPDKLDNGFYKSLEKVSGAKPGSEDNGQDYLFYTGAKIWQGDKDPTPAEDYGITNWKIVDFTNGFTIGVTAHFSATTYINESEKAVVVAYRGTNEDLEWLNNFAGVLVNVTGEEPQAIAYAQKQYATYAPDYKIYLTGHSLGGYLAQVAAASLIMVHGGEHIGGIEYFNGIGLNYGNIASKLIAAISKTQYR